MSDIVERLRLKDGMMFPDPSLFGDAKREIERLRAVNAELELQVHATEQEALQEIAKRDAVNAALVEALERADHTLSVHGKIDGGTDLHEFICAALTLAKREKT